MEKVDLDALDALHAAATPGEWRVSITSNEDSCLGRYVFQVVEYPYKGNHEIFAANPHNRSEEELIADVELTAALHNAYPALAAELRALRRERDTLRAKTERLLQAQKENDQLRSLLSTSSADCAYCGLPAKRMAECASGFPGCARADDMLCSATPTRDDLLQELAEARAEAARLREELELSAICSCSCDDPAKGCEPTCARVIARQVIAEANATAEWLAARDAEQRRIGAAEWLEKTSAENLERFGTHFYESTTDSMLAEASRLRKGE